MTRTRTTRRAFLGGLTAAAAGVPTLLRAQLAVEAINAAGGVKSLGGARLELLTADSETKADVARSEADRLINAGAQIMTGGYHSAHVATISLLAQQRRVPYVIDISAADAPTANAAKSVREGQQKTQYVYRIFPGSATFGRNAVRYMTEIFREAKVSPKRLVLLYSNDLFGKTQTDSLQGSDSRLRGGRRHPLLRDGLHGLRELPQAGDPEDRGGVRPAIGRTPLRRERGLRLRGHPGHHGRAERAASTDPDAVVAAIRKTSFAGGVTVSTGPVVFNELFPRPSA